MALKALFLNCTLKYSPETSNTQALIDKVADLMKHTTTNRACGASEWTPRRWREAWFFTDRVDTRRASRNSKKRSAAVGPAKKRDHLDWIGFERILAFIGMGLAISVQAVAIPLEQSFCARRALIPDLRCYLRNAPEVHDSIGLEEFLSMQFGFATDAGP